MTLISIPKYDPVYNVDLNFTGTTENMTIPAVQNLPSEGFTVELWIRVTAGNAGTLFSYQISPGLKLFDIEDVSNLNVWINGMQTMPTNVSLADGEWHYMALRWQANSGALDIIKDSTVVYSGVLAPGTTLVSGGALVFGQAWGQNGFDAGSAFDGQIYSFRLWSRPRTLFFIGQDADRVVPGNGAGISWQETQWIVNNGKRPFTIVAPVAENAVYGLDVNGKLLFSANFGETFEDRGNTQNFRQLAAASDWLVAIDTAPNTWISRDKGVSWTLSATGAGLIQASIAAGGAGLGVTASNTLLSTANFGGNWTPVTGYSFKWVSVYGVMGWAVGADKKLYYSVNLGNTWTALATLPWEPLQVECYANMVLVLTVDGALFYSPDNGISWYPVMTSYNIRFLNAQLFSNTIWAIDMGNQMIFSEFNTQLAINLMIDEGYGDAAFDSSGNNNDGVLGSDPAYTKPVWQVSTQLTPPGFIIDTGALMLEGQTTDAITTRDPVTIVKLADITETR